MFPRYYVWTVMLATDSTIQAHTGVLPVALVVNTDIYLEAQVLSAQDNL